MKKFLFTLFTLLSLLPAYGQVTNAGKVVRKERYTIAQLTSDVPCNASRVGGTVDVADGNRGQRTCRNTTGSTYTWVDNENGRFNVKYFGADATGATSTQDTIQAAIDAASSAGVLDVYVPAGTYKLTCVTDGTNNYGLKIANNIRLHGDGAATIFSVDAAAATRFVPILVQPATTVAFVELKDFVIDGNGKGQLDAGLIQANNTVRLTVDGVELKEGGTAAEASPAGVNGIAVAATASGTTQQVVLRNLYVHETTKAGINISTNAQNVVVENVRIKDITGNGEAPGLQINGSAQVSISNSVISDVEGAGMIVSTVGTPPSHTDSYNVIITGCFVSGAGTGAVAGDGIKIQNANGATALMSSRVLISDSTVFSNGVAVIAAGIRSEFQKHVTIQNCFIYGNSFAGVYLQSSQHVTIQGSQIYDNNTLNNASGSGVFLYGASGAFAVSAVEITGNHFLNSSNQKYPVAMQNDTGSDFTALTITDNYSSGHTTSNGFGVLTGTKSTSNTDVYRLVPTDGRVPYRASGRWADSENLKFDGTNFSISGTSKAIKFSTNVAYSSIDGLDNTLSSYQALRIGASGLIFNISGTDRISINSSALYPASAAGMDLGINILPFKNLYLAGSSGTPGTNNFKFTGTATAARTVTFPDASITVARTDAAQTFTGDQTFAGDLIFSTSGKTLQIKTGSNACSGSATLSSGTATVNTTCTGTTWGTDFIVILTPRGSSTGALRVSTHTAATSFVITSTDVASSDAVGWVIIKQN